jgi:hypothetical protein
MEDHPPGSVGDRGERVVAGRDMGMEQEGQ